MDEQSLRSIMAAQIYAGLLVENRISLSVCPDSYIPPSEDDRMDIAVGLTDRLLKKLEQKEVEPR